MLIKKFLFALVSLLSLPACKEEKSYTVDEFLKDDHLRAEWIKKCENGEVRPELLNCINVAKAKDKKISHNLSYLKNFGK